MHPNQLSKRQNELLQELNEKMSAEIMELMQKHTLPEEFIHPKFSEWLVSALPHETAKTMATSYVDFKKFWIAMHKKAPKVLHLWEMGFAINCVESKSMVQLNVIDPDDYIVIQDAITEMAIRWNEMVNNVKKATTDRYKILMDRVKRNEPIIVPDKTIIH